MAILYKSAKLQTYSYFVIYPLIITVIGFLIYKLVSYGQFSIFIAGIFLIFVYVFILALDSLYRLRYIEITEDHIIVKGITGDKIIEFGNVEAVYNLININGNTLIVWYKEVKNGQSKAILVRPDENNPKAEAGFPLYSYGDTKLSITDYIKDKAIKANPDYNYAIKPRWFLFGIK